MNVTIESVQHPNESSNMTNCAGVMQLQADYVKCEGLIVLFQ